MIELLTPREMAEADRLTAGRGVSGLVLMERAGAAVAEAALAGWPDVTKVVVLAGPGANGGDGFVAARHLAAAGRDVRVALFGDPAALKGDAAAMAAQWRGSVTALDDAPLAWAELVIDALFGAGLSRPLDGVVRRTVEDVNTLGCPVLSVDVPSGVDGLTGEAGFSIRATETVTFARLKLGHVLMPGRERCGAMRLADIGIPESVIRRISARAFLNRPALWRSVYPTLATDQHKYGRGHVAVWSGPALSTGASRLSAIAALRVGAGAVTLVGDRDALLVHAAHVTAVMLRDIAEERLSALLARRPRSAVVVGPGAGATEATRSAIVAALESGCPAVLDADVFSVFAGRSAELATLIAAGGGEVVLTPHEGEFARLFAEHGENVDDEPGIDPALAHPSKLERARAAAAKLGAVVVLKGADTVVASPDGRAAIADNAPPYLATAGAGDVLAGVCAGLLAQGMPAFEAASAAVWLHGEAAKQIGRGLIADDLAGALPTVLRRLESDGG